MVVKVGINGFGRIGRIIFRTCQQHPGLEVAAINDPAIDVEYICYLMKFDSTHGKFTGKIAQTHSEITVDDTTIKIFHEKLPSNVPWQSADVQYVVEASGIFTSMQRASGHLENNSVKRVIVTAPSADVPMVIMGVNQGDVNTDKRVISSASSTLYCLAPIVKILNDNFGVSEGFITSIHAMSPSLKPLDGLCLRGKHWRDYRSIHQNIIPATTGACKALGKIIPQVKDKLVGLAFRVPIVNVSVLDITVRLNRDTSLEEITKAVDALSKSSMHNIVKISNEEAVSSDFAGDQHSCILDVDSCLQHKKNFFKLVCWYENEYSYACRVVDLILFSEKQFQLPDPRTKMTFVGTKTRNEQIQKKAEQANETGVNTCQRQQQLQMAQVLKSQSQIRISRTRLPSQAVIVKKSNSSSRNSKKRNDTKSNEIFRIWNDEIEIKKQATQNRSSIHHSDIEITPHSQISNLRAQIHLENVKKEFTKMVSITENLLKKCSTIRDIKCPDSYLKEEINVTRLDDDAHDATKKSRNNKTVENVSSHQQNNNIILDISGDFVSSAKNVSSKINYSTDHSSSCKDNSSKNNFSKDLLNCYYDNSLDFNISNSKLGSCDTLNTRTFSDNLASHPSNYTLQRNAKKEVDQTFQEQVVKTINNLIDGLSQSMQNEEENRIQVDDRNFPQELKNSAYYKENDCDSGFISPVKRHRIQAKFFCNGNNISTSTQLETTDVIENVSRAKSNEVKIKGNEIAEYHEKADCKDESTNSFNDNKEQEEYCSEELNSADRSTAMPVVSPSSKKEIMPEVLNDLSKLLTDPVIMYSENKKCAGSTLYTSNNSGPGRKTDLYDKLDSVSASDSENSFQIHERKSQVINLTELSNSIEDLVRLDKICRIIEISDELSDKLFSALGSTDVAAMKKAKWSFKDLCKRIKLDEFCNKLFASQNQ